MTLRDVFVGGPGRRGSTMDAASIRSSDATVATGDDFDDSDDQEGGSSGFFGLKLKSLFDRRTEDLFILLDEPHKVFSPGDAVRGKVNLTLTRPTRTLYTSLRFSGQVSIGAGKQIVKTPLFQHSLVLWGQAIGSSSDGVDQTSQRNSLDVQNADSEVETCPPKASSWEIGIMDPGRHVFDFEFHFPTSALPSTLDFGRGSINYSLRCEHQKPKSLTTRSRTTCRKNLSFLDAIDIGCLPMPKIRHIDPDIKSKRKEGMGKVQAYVELVRGGYLKGDTISLNIQVHHIKPIKNLKGTIATLYRLSRFDSSDVAPQSFRKDLSQSVSPLFVDPQSLEYRTSPRLRIPSDAFPTIKAAGPVSFRYFVEIVLDLNSKTTAWQSGTAAGNGDGSYNFSVETGGEAMETDSLKREKGAHCVVFEVVIGTKDTSNTRERAVASSTYSAELRSTRQRATSFTSQDSPREAADRASLAHSASRPDVRRRGSDLRPFVYAPTQDLTYHHSNRSADRAQYPLSKAELQRIENTILPSAPPPLDGFDEPEPTPSAPPLELVYAEDDSSATDGSAWVGHPIAAAEIGLRSASREAAGAPSEPQRSVKEEEVLRERASAPPGDHVLPALARTSAPTLEMLQDEHTDDGPDLPVYHSR